MHPAYSVIFFTTSSGAGYGLLVWLSVSEMFFPSFIGRWLAFGMLVLALLLITAGLLSSTFHLGHPERALGAFSQWRSSWLSREGVVAVATYIPSGLLGLIWLFGFETELTFWFCFASVIGAVLTVICTGMIYGSLPTIRQWNRRDVPWIYLGMAAATGGVLYGLILSFLGEMSSLIVMIVALCLSVAAAQKVRYWHSIDADPGQYTAEMALGVKGLSNLRPLDPPHTTPNFVMREMGYSVARKHALKLRRLAVICMFAIPLFAFFILGAVLAAPVAFCIATLSVGVGVAVERWLFFAEAEHVSQLYYGAARA